MVFFDFRASAELHRPWVLLPGAELYRAQSERLAAEIFLGKRAAPDPTFASLGMNGGVVVGDVGFQWAPDGIPPPLFA